VDDLAEDATLVQPSDHQEAARVGGVGLRMAGATERHQPVAIKVRAALRALLDVMHLETLRGQAEGLAPLSTQRGTAEQWIRDGKGVL
jgi:hypothetical protein